MEKNEFRHEVVFSGFSEYAIYYFDHQLSEGEIVFEPNFVGGRPAYFKVIRSKKADGRDSILCKFKLISKIWVSIFRPKITTVT